MDCRRVRNRYIFIFDMLMCMFSYIAAISFVFPVSALGAYFSTGFPLILLTTVTYGVVLWAFRLYNIDWIYTGAKEYIILLSSCICAGAISIILGLFVSNNIIFPKLNIAANFCCMAMICGIRFMIRLVYRAMGVNNAHRGKRTLIIGAGRLAVMLLRELSDNNDISYNVLVKRV